MKADDSFLWAANLFHRITKLHVNNIVKGPFALGHADNFVAYFELGIKIGRAARNELLDHAVAVL